MICCKVLVKQRRCCKQLGVIHVASREAELVDDVSERMILLKESGIK